MAYLTFHDTNLSIYEHGWHVYMTGPDIGRALGYERPGEHIGQIYARSKAEFSADMSTTFKLKGVDGRARITRVFSPRGALLLAIKAETARAAEFRGFVLDLLEGKRAIAGLPDRLAPLPASVKGELSSFWMKHKANRQFLKYVTLGLNNKEIALLCGWKNQNTVTKKRRAAEALGLITPPADLARYQAQGRHLLPGA